MSPKYESFVKQIVELYRANPEQTKYLAIQGGSPLAPYTVQVKYTMDLDGLHLVSANNPRSDGKDCLLMIENNKLIKGMKEVYAARDCFNDANALASAVFKALENTQQNMPLAQKYRAAVRGTIIRNADTIVPQPRRVSLNKTQRYILDVNNVEIIATRLHSTENAEPDYMLYVHSYNLVSPLPARYTTAGLPMELREDAVKFAQETFNLMQEEYAGRRR